MYSFLFQIWKKIPEHFVPGILPPFLIIKFTKLLTINCYIILKKSCIILFFTICPCIINNPKRKNQKFSVSLMIVAFMTIHLHFETGSIIFAASIQLVVILIFCLVHFCIVTGFCNGHVYLVDIRF